MTLTVAAFYKFAAIADREALRARLLSLGREQDIRGTILIASEGINGTVVAAPDAIDTLIGALRHDPRFVDLTVKLSRAEAPPFQRFKVRLKREIVTLGVNGVDPAARTGVPLDWRAWNALIRDPETILIDTRNAYEVAVGTFPGAIDPVTRAFGEFPHFVARALDPARHRKVAMFCTGGIRCEKASAYMLAQGFEQVFQLDGGILKYLETVPEAENQWQGECYVFDDRVALRHGIGRRFVRDAACVWASDREGGGFGQSGRRRHILAVPAVRSRVGGVRRQRRAASRRPVFRDHRRIEFEPHAGSRSPPPSCRS